LNRSFALRAVQQEGCARGGGNPGGAEERAAIEHSALLAVRFFSNRKDIFKLPFSRSAASRLGKSGLSISLVAACRAA
jgi:hypothetical protein